jgi:hypothetical protein
MAAFDLAAVHATQAPDMTHQGQVLIHDMADICRTQAKR